MAAVNFSAPAYHCRSTALEASPLRAKTTDMDPRQVDMGLVLWNVDTVPILRTHGNIREVVLDGGQVQSMAWLTVLGRPPTVQASIRGCEPQELRVYCDIPGKKTLAIRATGQLRIRASASHT